MSKDTGFESPKHLGNGRRSFLRKLAGFLVLGGFAGSSLSIAEAGPLDSTETKLSTLAGQILKEDLSLALTYLEEQPPQKTIAGILTTQNYAEYMTEGGVRLSISLNEDRKGHPIILTTRIDENNVKLDNSPIDVLAKYYRSELLERMNETDWTTLPSSDFGAYTSATTRQELVIEKALLDGSHVSFAKIQPFTPHSMGQRSLQVSILYPETPYYEQKTAFQSAFKYQNSSVPLK